jgi:DNA-binding response OmpR family regulator
VAQILLVEDDASVREAVSLAIEAEGHRVTVAGTGPEGLERWRATRPDLVLLDVMLPGLDGFEVCREIRRTDQVPIIMLTARADAIDVVVGLESGADDYVTKPFETRVLVARMRAVLRRNRREPEPTVLRFGDVEVDVAGMVVTKAGAEVRAHPDRAPAAPGARCSTQVRSSPARCCSRRSGTTRTWVDSRLVDVCVQRLRPRSRSDPAAPALIQTVRGVGYKLVPPR